MRIALICVALLALISAAFSVRAQSIDQDAKGDCNSAINSQGNVHIECHADAGGDPDFIFADARDECAGMPRQFTAFFEDAVDWKLFRPISLPRLSSGLLQGIVTNSKGLFRNHPDGYLAGFRAASEMPHLLDEIGKDRVSPYYSLRIDAYLTAIQRICKWAGVEIDVKAYRSRYETAVLMGRHRGAESK